jgi:hypothetical protein
MRVGTATALDAHMPIVHGLFAQREQAVATLEALRAVRFDLDRVRLVGGPSEPGELAREAGAGTSVAAGPASAVLGGLLQGRVPEEELQATERRLSEGAVLLLSDDLDDAASQQLMAVLRERGAEHISSSSAFGPRQ